MTSSTHHAPPASGDGVILGGDEITFRVTGADSGGAVVAAEVRIPAGGGPPMLHRHDSFELYRLDRGELVFHVSDERGRVTRAVAGPGAVVAIPGGREHTVRNESGEEARAFVVFSPGLEMERFFGDAGRLAARGAVPVEDVLALAAAHGVEMTRPLDGVG